MLAPPQATSRKVDRRFAYDRAIERDCSAGRDDNEADGPHARPDAHQGARLAILFFGD
jgi:hypothetical protein